MPAVRYALGIGGLIGVISLLFVFQISPVVAVLGSVVLFVLMGLLVTFARVATLKSNKLTLPAVVFTWFILIIFIAVTTVLFSSVFFRRPVDLQFWVINKNDIVMLDGASVNLRRRKNQTQENALGEAYQLGKFSKKNLSKAAFWYQKGIDKDDPESMADMAAMLGLGVGVPQDIDKAIELFLRAGRMDNGPRLYKTGLYYREKDQFEKALGYLQKALKQKYTPAYAAIGRMHENGDFGKENITEAVGWYLKGASSGDPDSMYNLATLYFAGEMVQKNPKAAINLLEKVIRKKDYDNSATAMWVLGEYYNTEDLAVYDPQRAIKLYRLAMRQGQPCARVALADALISESPFYLQDAVKIIREGVREKQVQSIFYYAKNLLEGNGFRKNAVRAERLLKIGVDLGHTGSMLLLANAYETGLFGEPDLPAAETYYQLTAESAAEDIKWHEKQILRIKHIDNCQY